MSDVTIREMTSADLPAVSKLAAQLVRLHGAWDPRRFMVIEPVEQGYQWWLGEQLGEASVVLLVALVDGALAGYLYGAVEPRDWAMLLDEHGAIHDVFVDERFRRHGVAKRLCEAGLEALRARGAKRVVLHTTVQNAQAQALFTSLGFRPTMIEMTWGG